MLPLDGYVGKLKIKEQKGNVEFHRTESKTFVCGDVVKRYVVDAAEIEGYKVRMDL
jgi:hypothetical protein